MNFNGGRLWKNTQRATLTSWLLWLQLVWVLGPLCPGSVCSVCIRSMKPVISSWIQEVPSSHDLWTHSKSPLTPGSVSLLQMDLFSLSYWPSETGSAHFPWSVAVHFDPWHQEVCFLLLLDLWSPCWFWPQAGSFLSVRWMKPLLFPSESRPSFVWSRRLLPFWW